MTEPGITVAICTHNRSDWLPKAIESVLRQTSAPESFEILVVDNASTDSTKTIVQRYDQITNPLVRYIYEPQLGIARARNRAIHEARGAHIIFLDDDAYASQEWILEHQKAWQNGYRAVVGPVELDWRGTMPSWVTPQLETLFARYNFGEHDSDLPANAYLITTNASFEKKLMLEFQGFNEALGHRGRKLLGGEDNELFARLVHGGITVRYLSKALVHHAVLPERVHRSWVIKRIFWDGVGIAHLNHQNHKPSFRWIAFEAVESIRFWLKAMIHFKNPWLYSYPALQYAGRFWANLTQIKFRRH